MSKALRAVANRLAGASVALVSPVDPPSIVVLERQSFLAHLPEMGLGAADLRFGHPHDLYSSEVSTVLSDADVVVKLVHGDLNRSGLIQAVLRSLGARCAGHDTHTDVLSQHKSLVKQLVVKSGIPTLPYALLAVGPSATIDRDALRALPPAAGYVLKADDTNASEGLRFLPDLDAVAEAVRTSPDRTWLVEPYAPGRVLTVPVATIDGEVHVLEPMEYLLSAGHILMDKSWKRNPHRTLATGVRRDTREAVMRYAIALHSAVDARGLSRSDFILTGDDVVALETNTSIGLSETHDIAAAFRENGLDYSALLWAHLASAPSARDA